jgi:hypothetical protein
VAGMSCLCKSMESRYSVDLGIDFYAITPCSGCMAEGVVATGLSGFLEAGSAEGKSAAVNGERVCAFFFWGGGGGGRGGEAVFEPG